MSLTRKSTSSLFYFVLSGAFTMATDLRSEVSVRMKLQQVFKEALAIWHKNGVALFH